MGAVCKREMFDLLKCLKLLLALVNGSTCKRLKGLQMFIWFKKISHQCGGKMSKSYSFALTVARTTVCLLNKKKKVYTYFFQYITEKSMCKLSFFVKQYLFYEIFFYTKLISIQSLVALCIKVKHRYNVVC